MTPCNFLYVVFDVHSVTRLYLVSDEGSILQRSKWFCRFRDTKCAAVKLSCFQWVMRASASKPCVPHRGLRKCLGGNPRCA